MPAAKCGPVSVAEFTCWISRPGRRDPGVVRKERPHPGAQMPFPYIGRQRGTCFATDAKAGQLADLELRHRRRARCGDRIRDAKVAGLRNLSLHDSG